MTPEELGGFKHRLEELRRRSRDEILRMVQAVLDDVRPPGEHDSGVSESIAKEATLEETELAIRQQVLDALQRLEDGEFGKCQRCRRPIQKDRLDALPYASFCIACQRKEER